MQDEVLKKLEADEIRRLLEKHGNATLIPNDPDITGATVGQVLLLGRGIPGHTPELMDSLSMAANAVAVKLGSLRYHHRRYVEHLYYRLRRVESDEHIISMIKEGARICEREMLYEVDAFFHQFKSTLDMLVKILFIIFKMPPGKVSTYRRYGQGIIDTLRGQLNDKRFTRGRVEWLIEILEQAKAPWLTSVISTRDTLSHHRPYIEFGFEWSSGQQCILQPQAKTDTGSTPMEQVMPVQIENLTSFCTDFIAVAMSCLIPLEQGIQSLDEMEKRVIGARWGMDLSRAHFKLASDVLFAYTEADVEEARNRRIEELKSRKAV